MAPSNSRDKDITITCPEDCGNAPKKKWLKEFSTAIAKNDISLILERVEDHIHWHFIGDRLIQGKDPLTEMLNEVKKDRVSELHIKNMITHGREGAVHGSFLLENGKNYAFCDVYHFTSAGKKAKVKEIDSYIIEKK